MSFILESIKQAERERKLGQQAPSISIEYTGEHIGDVENNKMQWLLLSVGLVIAAIIVWSATNYYAQKDRQYIEELTVNDVSKKAPVVSEKRNIEMVPVKATLHSSDLKSVKLIVDQQKLAIDGPQDKLRVVKAKPAIKQESVKTITEDAEIISAKPKASVKQKLVVANKISDANDKQDLAAIYADLAEVSKQETMPTRTNALKQEAAEELVQIEIATVATSYVTSETPVTELRSAKISAPAATVAPSRSQSPAYKQQHEQAVSSGVPSFGELPYDVQEKIPDFNVSVHMFHTEPSQRRIRINGQMYTEGKSLQQDLALVEITRYGAVFDYQGHLFRLNVR